MCTGGQDIPVTLRVAGGVEGGKWKSSEDVRATPSPEEEVREETVAVTEETTPSSPMYKPVLDKLEKMSDNLPDETSRETLQVVMPRLFQNDQAMIQMNQHQMRMLDRIMRNTRRGRGPRGGIGDHVFGGGRGKGGGRGDPRIQVMPKPQQTLGANQQLAGLAGLIGKLERPQHGGVRRPSEPLQNPIQFPQQPTQQPMQPEVIEEQEQQMEVLGQPKQFSSGGIVNALMATPIGQSAIREYAEGGDIKFGDYTFDLGLTGDDPLDILRGKKYDDGRLARWFASKKHMEDPSQPVIDWGIKEEEVEESPTLKSVRRILKPPKEEHQDSEGGSPPDPNRGFVGPGPGAAMDKATGVDTFSGIRGDPFGLSGLLSGAMSQPGSTLANFVLGLINPTAGIVNSLSSLLGGPTVGNLFQSKSDLDKILETVATTKMGDQSAYDLYGGTHGALEAAEELGGIMGWDEGATASTDRGEQDVEAQIDTFSDYSDNAGSPGTGDSSDDDEAGAHGGTGGAGEAGEF